MGRRVYDINKHYDKSQKHGYHGDNKVFRNVVR